MDNPFTDLENEEVIAELPNDHAPGPNGFNGLFFKKCWHIVGHDIKSLCNQFTEGHINLQTINGSHIVLIPRTQDPKTVNDYRSVSLTKDPHKVNI